MIVYNLDSADIRNFNNETTGFGSGVVEQGRAGFDDKKPYDIHAPASLRGPGRDLILAPHVHIFKSMVEHDPRTTVRDVERRLRGLGIKFTARSAITNLARKHGIKLAA